MRRIQREIAPFDHDVPYLSDDLTRSLVGRRNGSGRRGEQKRGRHGPRLPWVGRHLFSSVFGWHRDPVLDFVAPTSDGGRPHRHDRRIRRNRAIATTVFFTLVLFWALARLSG
jgi:hypothetical protein